VITFAKMVLWASTYIYYVFRSIWNVHFP